MFLGQTILDSSRAGERDFSAWSQKLGPAKLLLRCDSTSGVAKLLSRQGEVRRWDDPLEALQWMAQTLAPQKHEVGRWVGFLSYDLGRYFEEIPRVAQDDLKLPLFVFTWHEWTDAPVAPKPGKHASSTQQLSSTFTRDQYLRAVERVVKYIAAGDVFQVNLSQRFTVGLGIQPMEVYRRLCEKNPAVYGAYLDYGDFALISNSPELFLCVTPDRSITTRPIKGTRPRIAGAEMELRNSLKDQAELNMIIDVERNDLGRICEIGSVKVPEPRVIEAHPTVYHGVATVTGTLREGVTFVEILRATFPTGSVTGAPKIRAMQIIDELEPTRRGPYCGAIGYLDSTGRMKFSVAIRTMIVREGLVHIPVGGGIVADSTPEAEYEETLVKAKAMFAAVGL